MDGHLVIQTQFVLVWSEMLLYTRVGKLQTAAQTHFNQIMASWTRAANGCK